MPKQKKRVVVSEKCMYGVSEHGSLLGIKKDIQSKFREFNWAWIFPDRRDGLWLDRTILSRHAGRIFCNQRKLGRRSDNPDVVTMTMQLQHRDQFLPKVETPVEERTGAKHGWMCVMILYPRKSQRRNKTWSDNQLTCWYFNILKQAWHSVTILIIKCTFHCLDCLCHSEYHWVWVWVEFQHLPK